MTEEATVRRDEPTLRAGDRSVYFRVKFFEPVLELARPVVGKDGREHARVRRIVAETCCTIRHAGEVVARGYSYLSEEDALAYNKRDGYHRSIKRALGALARVERLPIWRAWFARFEPKVQVRAKRLRVKRAKKEAPAS